MKPKENIEEIVKLEKPQVTTGGEIDKRTLNDSFAVMDKTIQGNKPSPARIILRNRAVKLAVAAAIIVTVGLLIIHQNPNEQVGTVVAPDSTQSPAYMRSILSLNIAYRRGGIEAVDRQCQRAMGMLGPRPAEVTIEQMLTEFNGT